MSTQVRPQIHPSRPLNYAERRLLLGGLTVRRTWRVLTSEKPVGLRLVELFGGDVERERGAVAVITRRDSVAILVDGPEHLMRGTPVGGLGGDGACSGQQTGRCAAYPLIYEKAAGPSGRGPLPEISLVFRLADDPDMGVFALRSAAWGFAATVPDLWRALAERAQPARCTLSLRRVEFTTASGFPVRYVEPAVVLG
ncbi:hypothetical protein [Streptomyces litchfieldiae]|uniref:Uncharacterized protein n=1 Tax=Streptomyces litchfieldiae TaxID=3075543 RepID=A0ABU2N2E7_9ACTN|nr:hypothetical protein [Streptomyces sp. DSM 44938]MDT0347787.1 hypothetical protein [Streptomyces sp. DSM 44938]